MIKAVIFDCFGVLVGDGLEIVCQDLAVSDPDSMKFIREMMYLSNSGQIEPQESNRRIVERLGLTPEEWRSRINQGEVRNQEMLDMVEHIHGPYKTALLSNIGKGSLKLRFSDDELAAYFDVVVPSAEVGMMKPQAEIYVYTAEQLGVEPSECVFLDDREEYVEAAKQVGMKGVWFRSAAQAREELDKLLGDSKD